MSTVEWSAWVEAIGTWVGAFATFTAALVALGIAVFGERVVHWLWRPKLELRLHDPAGDLTYRGRPGGTPVRYYHIKVVNTGHARAERAKVRIERIDKQQADGVWHQVEAYLIPVHLQWVFSLTQPEELQTKVPTIWSDDDYYCDVAFLDKGGKQVCVPSYENPNNFPGHVGQDSGVRLHLRASAQNCRAKSALIIEILWDGQWADDPDEMQNHLRIREVKQ